MRGKIYTGHVGDSCIVLGYQDDGSFYFNNLLLLLLVSISCKNYFNLYDFRKWRLES
jgi:hypothetical protein